MPEPSNVGDLWQVRVKGFLMEQETNNILHFACKTATADVELVLIQALIQCFILHVLPVASDKLVMDTVTWKKVTPVLGVEFITPFPVDSHGAVVGDALPSFAAALLSIRTSQGGRSKRGRMYIAGIPEAGGVGNDLAPSWQNAMLNFALCLVTKFITGEPLGGNAFQLGVYSRKLGGSTFPYGAAGFTSANRVDPVNVIATMRSRKKGRGV